MIRCTDDRGPVPVTTYYGDWDDNDDQTRARTQNRGRRRRDNEPSTGEKIIGAIQINLLFWGLPLLWAVYQYFTL